ncbi:MAG TPA: PEGA domain-containing protein [Polyangiaceae bacterium]|jgi:tetratricopeptide (TPR) repeat protein
MSLGLPASPRFWLALLALNVAVPSSALAADAPSDEAVSEERRAAAKGQYQQGVQAYEQGHFKDAVDAFLAADRLSPSAPLSFNIARAYEKLGDGSSALRWYRDYLRRSPAAPNADAVREIVSGLAAALAKKGLQQVTVLSTPVGATVSVDEQPVGVTPWTGELAPGTHHLLLSSRNYSDVERDVVLTANTPLDVSLRLELASSAPIAAAPAPAPAAVPASKPASPSTATGKKLGALPWITLGAGAAVLGSSLTFELLRRSSESAAKNDHTQVAFQSDLDTMDSRRTAARVLLGVGGALVVAGGVMLVLDRSSASGSLQSVGFGCFPGACAASARGNF